MKNQLNTRNEKLTMLTDSELRAVSGGSWGTVGRWVLGQFVSYAVRNYSRGSTPNSGYGQSNYSGYKSW